MDRAPHRRPRAAAAGRGAEVRRPDEDQWLGDGRARPRDPRRGAARDPLRRRRQGPDPQVRRRADGRRHRDRRNRPRQHLGGRVRDRVRAPEPRDEGQRRRVQRLGEGDRRASSTASSGRSPTTTASEACAELFTTAFAAKLARGTGTRAPTPSTPRSRTASCRPRSTSRRSSSAGNSRAHGFVREATSRPGACAARAAAGSSTRSTPGVDAHRPRPSRGDHIVLPEWSPNASVCRAK